MRSEKAPPVTGSKVGVHYGGRVVIAFVMEDSTFTNDHIWVAEAGGTNRNVRQVTSGTLVDLHPAWSPGSGIIYFASDRSGGTEIWKVGFKP